MTTFRVTFPGDTPAQDFQADKMKSDGSGARLYRTVDGEDQEIAFFYSGTYTGCYEVPAE